MDVEIMEQLIPDTKVQSASAIDGDWRDDMESLRSKLGYVLSNGLFSDLTCIVGTGDTKEEIPCHSLILRLQSGTFDKTFTVSDSGTVELPKYEPRIFRLFLKV